ncbi:extracellular catalytic domain type 2 short-chain-length polyhydroxyalkanoate depolymerase [Microvirgula aerodenitrificans]|uniref:extracellular catalytic domain type 2 short-chain-length polyhydroxyalkanoate depolymerase n=1 Tax=Microvirgula aerodenitrificans TaxID=57480 RepID=UPI00248DDD6F|nr:PHB depolymerase family esterase [Microvirgula aerodenitrificans]
MSRHRHLLLTTLLVTLTPVAFAAQPLPAFNGDAAQSSVSGLSSGAFMAFQYLVANSASVKGAGVVAGGPYYCAVGNLPTALSCMNGLTPAPAVLLASAETFELMGQIDALSHLAKRRAYLFSGTSDSVVQPAAVEAGDAFLRLAGMPDAQRRYVGTLPAGHALITPAFGNACDANKTPYISHCAVDDNGYDQAGAILTQIDPELKPPSADIPAGRLVAFDQKPFTSWRARMASEGHVYVPRACERGEPCRVHIALHGCKQSSKTIGDLFYTRTGYNRWADSNNLLILYPQVDPTPMVNPSGCWDWWGYSGADYAWKGGAQITAIKAMADHLVSAPLPSPATDAAAIRQRGAGLP